MKCKGGMGRHVAVLREKIKKFWKVDLAERNIK